MHPDGIRRNDRRIDKYQIPDLGEQNQHNELPDRYSPFFQHASFHLSRLAEQQFEEIVDRLVNGYEYIERARN